MTNSNSKTMWRLRRQGTILVLAFGCWCFTLLKAQPSMEGPSHCDELCEFSPWAMHAYCGERALSEIPQICSQVKTLDVRLNNIETLTNGSLSSFGHLKYLYLDDNGMTVVEAGAFEGCDGLQFLSIGGNPIQNLTKGMLGGLTNLMFMLISRSDIQEIEPEIFGETPLLKTLDLTRNNLVSPPCDAFVDDNVLTDLYLSDNLISDLPSGCFAKLTRVERLKLSNNPIQAVGNVTAFRGLNSLRKMELDNTSLRAIPVGAFSYVHTTTHLYLQYNFIESIQERNFETLPNLEHLNLEHNIIKTIHIEAFLGMNNLKVLVLSFNRIVSLGLHALLPVEPTLQEVHLHDNNLPSIHNMSSSTILSLEKLLLARNPLKCHCHLYEFQMWLKAHPDVLAHQDGYASCLTPDDEVVRVVNSSLTHARCQKGRKTGSVSVQELQPDSLQGNTVSEESIKQMDSPELIYMANDAYDNEESLKIPVPGTGDTYPTRNPLLFTLIALIVFTCIMSALTAICYFRWSRLGNYRGDHKERFSKI